MLEEKFSWNSLATFFSALCFLKCCSSANLHICSSWRLIQIWFSSFVIDLHFCQIFLHLIYFFTDLYYYTYHIYYTYVYLSYPIWVNFLGYTVCLYYNLSLLHFFHVLPPQCSFYSSYLSMLFFNVFNLGVPFLPFFLLVFVIKKFFQNESFDSPGNGLELERTKGYCWQKWILLSSCLWPGSRITLIEISFSFWYTIVYSLYNMLTLAS